MNSSRTLLLACTLALGAATSHAEGKVGKVEAKKHYDLGKAHFALKDWDKAIEQFKSAYEMFPDPVNLYNIAQAYRLKEDCSQAAVHYARYQREENNKRLRDSVNQVRAKMEDCAAAKPKEPLPVLPSVPLTVGQPPTTPVPLGTSAAPPLMTDNALRPVETPNLDPNRNRRILGLVLLGTGGVSVLLGLANSVVVSDLDRQIGDCEDSIACGGDRFKDLEDQRDRASLKADASYALGVTALVVGGVIYAVSRKPKRDNPMTVVPTRGGAAVGWTF